MRWTKLEQIIEHDMVEYSFKLKTRSNNYYSKDG